MTWVCNLFWPTHTHTFVLQQNNNKKTKLTKFTDRKTVYQFLNSILVRRRFRIGIWLTLWKGSSVVFLYFIVQKSALFSRKCALRKLFCRIFFPFFWVTWSCLNHVVAFLCRNSKTTQANRIPFMNHEFVIEALIVRFQWVSR